MGFTVGAYESVKRGEKRSYRRFALPIPRDPDPSSYFPNSFLWGLLGSSRVWTGSVGGISKEEQHRCYPQQVNQREGEAHQEEDRLEGQVRLLAPKVDKEQTRRNGEPA
jgi:hypothetical protein